MIRLFSGRIPEAERGAMRYAGPYPTPALWHALARSCRTTAREAEFTAGVMERALRVARDELPIDFVPAPCERIAHAHGWTELRDALERAVIDGVTYEAGTARLVSCHAEIWIGDALYARVASFDDTGALIDGPRADGARSILRRGRGRSHRPT